MGKQERGKIGMMKPWIIIIKEVNGHKTFGLLNTRRRKCFETASLTKPEIKLHTKVLQNQHLLKSTLARSGIPSLLSF